MTDIVIREERQRQAAILLLSKLDLSKTWSFSIKRHKKTRTLHQNNLYWKWIGIISDDTGNDADAIHEYYKKRFLTPIIATIGDDSFMYRTTTKLETVEMSAYMERVYQHATGELGIILPVPEMMHTEAV